jgi:glycosyltransferase involved in cell wall biosynthesis
LKKIKVVYIISDIDKALAFEWLGQYLKSTFDLHFVLIGSQRSKLSVELSNLGISVSEVYAKSKISMALALMRVLIILGIVRPHVIHTHLMKANLIGLTAGWLLRIKKRVYTRHHAMVHHREHRKGLWMDRWCNFSATHIIAISENVRHILTAFDKAASHKVKLIHHGFDVAYLESVPVERVQALRVKYKISDSNYPVVGVISRYVQWKGIQHIIPAFARLVEVYPNAHLILANTQGDYKKEIEKLLANLPVGCCSEILFEDDLSSLYKLMDIYIHAPIDAQCEAFGQTYVEALASGIPSIFTLSGVAPEFIVHEENALVVPFCDTESIFDAMDRILNDIGLKEKIVANGRKSTLRFSIDEIKSQLMKLYFSEE